MAKSEHSIKGFEALASNNQYPNSREVNYLN